jgi:7,8-dihydropterin-6-yl-methyl-4-(beta-D-ribofuranosyl)aminobenzene 5'-phosphate synthase
MNPNPHRFRATWNRIAWAILGAALVLGPPAARAAATADRVHALKVTLLSTMLADGHELGEWGFSALVAADGHRILFDTGAHSDLVLKNAQTLGIDLSTVPEVILSHCHPDHVGGFLTLRRAVMAKAPGALATAHVGEGIFYPRTGPIPLVEINPMIGIRPQYEEAGGVFVVHRQPVELYPGVWLTGPVPRKYPERNWSGHEKVKTPSGVMEDQIPEDMSLVLDTDRGLVIITGCGHAGIANIVDYSRQIVRPARIHALIGGIHLVGASDEVLSWTAGKLAEAGVDNFIGAHCTGLETVYRFRQDLGLDRAHAVVGAVGATFTLGEGINPGEIAQ